MSRPFLPCALGLLGALACATSRPASEAATSAPTSAPAQAAPAPAAPAEPAVSESARAHAAETLAKARDTLRAGKPDEALPLALEAAREDPQLADAPALAGQILLQQGREAAAAAQLEQAVRLQPDHDASENLTRLRLKAGRAVEAEQDLARRVALAPASLPLRVQFVRVLIAEGRLEVALVEAKKVLKTDERNVPALLALADAWYREKKYELARDVLENAAALDPKSGEARNAQGFVFLALEQKPQALEAFRSACALAPGLAEAHNNLGALLNEASDFTGAAKELQLASRLQPDRAAIWLNLGNALRGAHQDREAEQAYLRAREVDAKSLDPLFNLGLLYLDGQLPGKPASERLAQANAWFEQFKAAGGSDPRLARYQGEAVKGLQREKDRLAREERDKLKRREADRKAEEARKQREASKLGHLDEDEPAPRHAPPGAQPKPAARPSGKLSGGDDK